MYVKPNLSSVGINTRFLENLNNWFSDYVGGFKGKNPAWLKNIILKEDHTKRVCEEIVDLGGKLGLNQRELNLVHVIALMHDIGRFEQYARYQTFADHQSIDHAACGVEVLQHTGVLGSLDESIRELILRIISYHNRLTLPTHEDEICLFITKLLRDADKLDIWQVVIDYYQQMHEQRDAVIELGLPNTQGNSPHVVQDLLEGRIIEITNLANLNDLKLLQISWIYDINFKPTFQTIKKRHYLETLFDQLPETKELQQSFATVLSYLEKCLREREA
jgi:hypothetical protein